MENLELKFKIEKFSEATSKHTLIERINVKGRILTTLTAGSTFIIQENELQLDKKCIQECPRLLGIILNLYEGHEDSDYLINEILEIISSLSIPVNSYKQDSITNHVLNQLNQSELNMIQLKSMTTAQAITVCLELFKRDNSIQLESYPALEKIIQDSNLS